MNAPATDLVPHNVVSEIVAHRDAALARMREAVELMGRGQLLVSEAESFAASAHRGARAEHDDGHKGEAYRRLFAPLDPAASLDAYRRQLDARVWMHIYTRTGLDRLMDHTAKAAFRAGLAGEVPEVTEESIYATLEGFRGDAKLIFQRGLAAAFSSLDGRFRSHDAFKLGDRVILTNVFDAWGSWNYHSAMRDTITDLERVFAVLDGVQPDIGALARKIAEDRTGGFRARQSVTESTYFRVRCFKNGNAHLWFTRDDLVQRANEQLADYYGAALPDAVPREAPPERSYELSKDLAFYFTPEPVVRRMLADISLGAVSHVLEPSAGEGHIVRHLLATGASVHAVEVEVGRVARLRAMHGGARLGVVAGNFLRLAPQATYTHVVMNPPFSGTHWMDHVMHAYDFLRPGGVLVAVLPVSAELGTTKKHVAFRAWASERVRYRNELRFQQLPAESFAAAGTRVSTVLLTLVHR